jgi:hypothetical protein
LSGLWRWRGRRCEDSTRRRAPTSTWRGRPDRARSSKRRLLTLIPLALVAALTLNSRDARAQRAGYFIGESTSRGASLIVFCGPSGCSTAELQSNRSLRSLVIGVERRLLDRGVAHVSLSGALSRRGWYTGTWRTQTTLSVPVMGMVEPFGAGVPLGIAAGAGVAGDVNVERPSDSQLSLTAGFWIHAPVWRRLMLSVGMRESRATRRQHGLHMKTRVVTLGLSSR